MTQPEKMPSPERVGRELDGIRHIAEFVISLCDYLDKGYEEAYETGLMPARRGDVMGGRGSGFSDTDPTGNTVISWDQRRIRSAVRFVGRRVRGARGQLAKAEAALVEAFWDIDPDYKAKRMQARREALAEQNETKEQAG